MIVTKGESVSSMVEKLEEKKTQEDVLFVRSNDHPQGGGGGQSQAVDPKPFFIMDWLEKIIPKDLEIAQQFLYTPNKETQPSDAKQLLEESIPRELFTPSTTTSILNHQYTSCVSKTTVATNNCVDFRMLPVLHLSTTTAAKRQPNPIRL